jgi:hypothetical protein
MHRVYSKGPEKVNIYLSDPRNPQPELLHQVHNFWTLGDRIKGNNTRSHSQPRVEYNGISASINTFVSGLFISLKTVLLKYKRELTPPSPTAKGFSEGFCLFGVLLLSDGDNCCRVLVY